ncbi:hypothetical protein [Peribacillus butanolivorans]|uniref:hypothetical protein n=1 Tax=Peribacillus butanolivorans TaxID=421767 RepID=UPI0006A71083|nr:hypothetical protein [Peribacillus butanolivorans]
MELKEKKIMGRPPLPLEKQYRKKKHRFGRIEDKFTSILSLIESEKDRKLILDALEELKA